MNEYACMLPSTKISELITQRAIKCTDASATPLIKSTYLELRIGKYVFLTSEGRTVELSDENSEFVLEPGATMLLASLEMLRMPMDHSGLLGINTSMVLRGLSPMNGLTVDPGFEGILVVGFQNTSPFRVRLNYRDEFGKLQFFRLPKPVSDDLKSRSYPEQRDGKLPKSAVDYFMHCRDIGQLLKELERKKRKKKLLAFLGKWVGIIVSAVLLGALAIFLGTVLIYLLQHNLNIPLN